MTESWKRAAAAGALCLGIAAVATAGMAQDRPPAPGGPQRGEGQHGPDRQKMFEEMRQRRDQRLHDLLQIKPDQETAFHTFLAAVEPPHREGNDSRRGLEGRVPGLQAAPMTTPQRLDRMTARIAREQAVVAATRVFYGALSSEQRKAFDAMPMQMGHRGHGHMGGGHRFEGQR